MKAISIINDLQNHTIDLLRNENLSDASKNIDLLFKLLSEALKTTSKPEKSDIVMELYNSLKNFVIRFRDMEYYDKSNDICIRIVKEIYKPEFRMKLTASNSFFNYSSLEIELIELVSKIIRFVSSHSTSNSIENSKILELLKELTRNSEDLYRTEMFRFIPEGFSYYFNLINEHHQLTNKEKDDLQNQLISNLFDNTYEWFVKFPQIEEVRLRIFIYILIKLSEQCILKDYRNIFNNIMSNYYDIINKDYNNSSMKFLYDLFINVNIIHLFNNFLRFNDKHKIKYNEWMDIINANKSNKDIRTLYNIHITNVWDTYKQAKSIISTIEYSYVKPGKMFSPTMEYRLLDYYFFSTVVLLEDYSKIDIHLNIEDYHILSRFFDKNDNFNFDSKKTKEYLNRFFKFTGITELDEAEFIRRTNKLYKHVEMINEKVQT